MFACDICSFVVETFHKNNERKMDLLASEYTSNSDSDDANESLSNATTNNKSKTNISSSLSSTLLSVQNSHSSVVGPMINAAPIVHVSSTSSTESTNPQNTALQLYSASSTNPNPLSQQLKSTLTGTYQKDGIDSTIFSQQYNLYKSYGYTVDPTGNGMYVGDMQRYIQHQQQQAFNHNIPAAYYPHYYPTGYSVPPSSGNTTLPSTSSTTNNPSHNPLPKPGQKRSRYNNDDTTSENYLGPWAGYEGEEEKKLSALEKNDLTLQQKLIRIEQGLNPDGPGKLEGEELTLAKQKLTLEIARAKAKGESLNTIPSMKKQQQQQSIPPEQTTSISSSNTSSTTDNTTSSSTSKSNTQYTSSSESDAAYLAAADAEVQKYSQIKSTPTIEGKSIFHGKEEYDYQGRSWIEPPKGIRPDNGEHNCYIPKKCIHKFTGHTKGVQSIQFFPSTGHLLLSGSLDGKCKIWDINSQGKPLQRTYIGHYGGIRNIQFDNTGIRFASCSYDRHTLIWDTETGKIKHNITDNSVPYSLIWHPLDNNICLIASSNRKILQYDLRTPDKAIIEYDYHLGPVNTLMFFDQGKRFLSTSDDKKMLIWETGTPVPIKFIADPSMHSIPVVAKHPSNDYFVGQSMDNTLVVYTCDERVSRVMKKTFKGHVTAGYSCQPSFSPDGHFLCSGDGEGQVWFWDWHSGRVLDKLKAHDTGPAISTIWHPLQPSWVATCGWDGIIKLWD